MVLTWSQRFPPEAKPRIEALIRKTAKWWGFDDYEIAVTLGASGGACASLENTPESHRATLKLDRRRLGNANLERDVCHELLHIPRWELMTIVDLGSDTIPDTNAKRAFRRACMKLLEHDHDTTALVWLRLLPFLP
jgi:hypothetical protein